MAGSRPHLKRMKFVVDALISYIEIHVEIIIMTKNEYVEETYLIEMRIFNLVKAFD